MAKKIASICLASQQSGWSDHFATMMDGISKTDYVTTVYTSQQAAKSFDIISSEKINLIKFEYNKKNIFASIIQLYKIGKDINMKKYDAVFFYGESPQHLIVMLLINGAIVSHIADPNPHSGVKILNRILFKITHVAYLIKAKKIFFSSNAVLKQFELKYKYLINNKKFKQKLNTVRFANLIQFEDVYNVENNKNNKKPKIWDFIYFGRDEPYKGLDILIDAIIHLENLGKRPSILIVSRNFIRDKKPNCITVVNDYISHEELATNIYNSKWGIFPYIDATGTHTVQICNKFGIPVLATNVGSFQDYIVETTNGALVEGGNYLALADKMLNIMNENIISLSGYDLQIWANDYFSNTKSTSEFKEIIQQAIS
jgi:glycosyltransferase involved in cell wall biosynthesis